MTHETDRRKVLAGLAAGAAAVALRDTALATPTATATTPDTSCGPATTLPNLVLYSHDGRRALFYNDLIRGRTVMLHFLPESAAEADALVAHLAGVQAALGERLGRDVFLYSFADAAHWTPRALGELAARHGAGPGWLFLTGEPAGLRLLRDRLFHDASHHHEVAGAAEDCSRGLIRYGNDAAGVWGAAPARSDPQWLAARIAWVTPRPAPQGPPRRRGPAAVAVALALAGLAGLAARAQAPAAPPPPPRPDCPTPFRHPQMQCQIAPPTVSQQDATTTLVSTGASLFPSSNPFLNPPGTNFLPTFYINLYDSNGTEIPNTLPSTPAIPYNLHDGEPVVSMINRVSPTDDLQRIFTTVLRLAAKPPGNQFEEVTVRNDIQQGIDILEGNPIPNRVYSRFPLLHYNGPDKVKKVTPIVNAEGSTVGGDVKVHQIWYDEHIESDTGLLDFTAVARVPWTITYTVDVLSRGKDDFSPFSMYFAAPAPPPPTPPMPGAGMDQTFFPVEEGTRTVLKIKMAPGEYYNLTYTWGWRWHPPRAQAMDNANKPVCTQKQSLDKEPCPKLQEWEVNVFGEHPGANEDAKQKAIAQIGDLDPAKRMWHALRAARDAEAKKDYGQVKSWAEKGREAFADWRDRTHLPSLPSGFGPDPKSDLTLFYSNNTIYGHLTDGDLIHFPAWSQRGATLRVTIYNGDYFDHGYQNVDFGGARGWENQFKSSVKVGGSGCWFTFGRAYWTMNLPPQTFVVPAATRGTAGKPDTPGVHKFVITYNYDPSRRLRFYQFDPLHHDVAIYSVH